MATMPPLEALAALLPIDPDDPADVYDLTVLRELLARREAAAAETPLTSGPAPNLRVVEQHPVYQGLRKGQWHQSQQRISERDSHREERDHASS